MDIASASLVALTCTLALSANRAGNIGELEWAVRIIDTVGIMAALSSLILVVPTLSLKLEWWLVSFLGLLIVASTNWLYWNISSFRGTPLDGTIFNSILTVMTLGLGLICTEWRVVVSEQAAVRKNYQSFLRAFPMLMTVLIAVTVALHWSNPVPNFREKILTGMGGLGVGDGLSATESGFSGEGQID